MYNLLIEAIGLKIYFMVDNPWSDVDSASHHWSVSGISFLKALSWNY
jgi:hypothetical protein